MLKLLKATYSYHKIGFFIALGFVIIINFSLIVGGRWQESQSDFPGMRVIWLLPISILFILFSTKFNHEKRNRIVNLLPINKYQIAFSKLFGALVFWLLILLMNFIIYLSIKSSLPSQTWLADSLSYTGIVLILSSVPLAYNDIHSSSKSKAVKKLLALGWTVIMLTIITFFLLSLPYTQKFSPQQVATIGNELKAIYFSPAGSLLFFLLGSVFFGLSGFIYTKRGTYLE